MLLALLLLACGSYVRGQYQLQGGLSSPNYYYWDDNPPVNDVLTTQVYTFTPLGESVIASPVCISISFVQYLATVTIHAPFQTISFSSVTSGTYYCDTGDNTIPELGNLIGQNPNGLWTIVLDGGGNPVQSTGLIFYYDTLGAPAPSPYSLKLTLVMMPDRNAGTVSTVYFGAKGLEEVNGVLSTKGIAKSIHTFCIPPIYTDLFTSESSQIFLNVYSHDDLQVKYILVEQNGVYYISDPADNNQITKLGNRISFTLNSIPNPPNFFGRNPDSINC